MKLIVGLGNPGTRYEGSRHNIGFTVVDLLAARWSVSLAREKFRGRFGEGEFAGQKVVLLQPITYMNLSGEALMAAGRFYKLDLRDLLVISDDMDLPLGRIRLRPDGGSGGHKGLSDIERRLGTQAYPRLRCGIGRGQAEDMDAVDWVLSRFSEQEQEAAAQTRQRAADAVECWIREGIDVAMNRFN
jgi:PTH1 family peptidyl-tRNA hydrolase